MSCQVLVVGSVSRDITVTVRKFPAPGETTIGSGVTYGLGGKGANQAFAAALTGVPTSFLGCVGDDDAGPALRAALAERGVGTDLLRSLPGIASGTAHITVDEAGENSIAIVQAANARVCPELVTDCAARGFDGAEVVLTQGEIPPATIEALGREVRGCSGSSEHPLWVVNLAPAVDVSRETLAAADVLVVNESEAASVLDRLGRPTDGDPAETARRLTEASPGVVLTVGERGSHVAVRGEDHPVHVPATTADTVVDTTGAGDAFTGVLGAALARGRRGSSVGRPLGLEELVSCARVASREAARVVSRSGASTSYHHFSLEEA